MKKNFGKKERLKSRKLIGQLFDEGKSFKKFPLKLLYLPLENGESNQVTVTVPKRSFKLAVHRNRIKRQMREAYRLNKTLIVNTNGTKFALLFLYMARDKQPYANIEKATITLLKKLHHENH